MKKKSDVYLPLASIILARLLLSVFLIAAGMAVIYLSLTRIADNFWDRTDISYITSQKKKLAEEKYSRINVGGGFKYSGYFEILDNNADVLYSSNPGKNNEYNIETLEFLPDTNSESSVYLERTPGSGISDIMLTFYSESEREEDEQIQAVYLLKGDGEVVFNSQGSDISYISPETISILQKASKHMSIQKYEFTTVSGAHRYLIYHTGNRRRLYNALWSSLVKGGIIAAFALSAIVLTFFWFKNIRLVRGPMDTLAYEMNDFARNREVNATDVLGRAPKEFKELEGSLAQLEQSLVDADREKDRLEKEKQRLLADISHDLKTPATVISGYAKVLSDGVASADEQKEYIEIIRRRSADLTDLINSFFEYSRLNYQGFSLKTERDDIGEFLREYFAGRYVELTNQGFSIEAQIPDREVMMSFDHQLMRRCFDNIVGNSVSHNEEGTCICVRLEDGPDDIRILLGDKGKGIPPELRSQIFTPFVTENESRTAGKGTGLGLSIAARIVELHNGTIRLADDQTGECSVLFEMRFPKNE
ncbi:MAG: sensor histidine kinase [Candidatus Weimeria sp.]